MIAPVKSGTFSAIFLVCCLTLASFSPARAGSTPADNCTAALSDSLSLDVPVLMYNGMPFQAGFDILPGTPGLRLTSGALLADIAPFEGCRPSLLSTDLLLHIPNLVFQGISFLADFEYAGDLSITLTGFGQTTTSVPYRDLPAASYQEGCVAPCYCPISIGQTLSGTFNLVQLNPSPLFNRFSLDDIKWTVSGQDGRTLHTITGFGTYEVGGEFAIMQRLVMELSTDGGDLVHYDSGQVQGGGDFPQISISADRGTSCYDVFINLTAAPNK